MQEIRRFKPSTVSRRFSVTAGFYRTCVIDGLLEPSPAEHVRRPSVPPESPTLGFTHLQFEALLTAARESSSPCDFALVAMLGLLGLRIFEATGGRYRRPRRRTRSPVLRVCGKGTEVVLIPLPPAVGRAIERAIGTRARGADPAQQPRHEDGPPRCHPRLRHLAQSAGVRITRPHPHMLRHTFVTTMQRRGVAPDTSFPGKREDGAIRHPGPCSPMAAWSAWREAAGQHGRVRTGLRHTHDVASASVRPRDALMHLRQRQRRTNEDEPPSRRSST